MIDERLIAEKFGWLAPHLDERRARLWVAAEARALGYGGVAAVARATGLAATRVRRGVEELRSGEVLERGRVRRAGAGRKPLVEQDPTLLADLDRLVDEDSRGDPESPLRWTVKSVRVLAGELRRRGHEVCASSLLPLLAALGFSLQSNRKVRDGKQHPDRDAQFRYINAAAQAALEAGEPVISVDTKKKELVGDFKNQGREWRHKGSPERVRSHDFNDTLTITADCGGSNGYRTRLWKAELQKLADEIARPIQVLHFPPGTSKWNRIEHRLFSFITINWRGKPLYSLETIIDLIAATTTKSGLKVYAQLDEGTYPAKLKVTNAEMAALSLHGHAFHPEWNYTIAPRAPRPPPAPSGSQPAAAVA